MKVVVVSLLFAEMGYAKVPKFVMVPIVALARAQVLVVKAANVLPQPVGMGRSIVARNVTERILLVIQMRSVLLAIPTLVPLIVLIYVNALFLIRFVAMEAPRKLERSVRVRQILVLHLVQLVGIADVFLL